ncbi:MAG: methyltransferase domain-containing protein [Promethearchaeota archaeon]
MKLIIPKVFFSYFPKNYHKYAGLAPYTIPIFGKMYFGRIKRIIKLFIKFKLKFSKVLEVGGGFGLFSTNYKLNFPECNLYLLDLYNKDILKIVKNVIKIKLSIKMNYFFECDIQKKTQFKDKSFDLIFALDVLEHIENPNLALDELFRILKQNGLIFISVPTESKLIKIFRKLYNKFKLIELNPHWNGKIKSEEEFYQCLKNKKIKILRREKYPFNSFPRLFSYDLFYLIQKKNIKK